MSNSIGGILEAPDKGIGEAIGVLPKLYRRILYDRNIGPGEFFRYMSAYLMDVNNGFGNDNKRRSYERSNLIKEMSRETMSWKVFVKCIRFLRPANVKFTVSLDWKSSITNHAIDFKVCDKTLEEFLALNEGLDDENNVDIDIRGGDHYLANIAGRYREINDEGSSVDYSSGYPDETKNEDRESDYSDREVTLDGGLILWDMLEADSDDE